MPFSCRRIRIRVTRVPACLAVNVEGSRLSRRSRLKVKLQPPVPNVSSFRRHKARVGAKEDWEAVGAFSRFRVRPPGLKGPATDIPVTDRFT